jgi:hypothetical protein
MIDNAHAPRLSDLRLSDFTLGSICRIGITLSSCFWFPASLLMGLAAAGGFLPDLGAGPNAPGLMGFVSGFLQGLAVRSPMMVLWCWARWALRRCAGSGPGQMSY